MSDPIKLRVHRPYGSVDELLAAEAWTMDAKSVVLIDQDELPAGTVVRFEIVLDGGEKPIRAEGVVHKAVAPRGKRPGGLKIRLKRIGAAAKATIDRAIAIRKSRNSLAPKRSKRPPPDAPPPEPATDAALPAEAPAAVDEPSEAQSAPAPEATTAPADGEAAADAAPIANQAPSSERSGVRHRRIVPPPADRDALLQRLRTRSSRLAKAPGAIPDESREDTG